MAKRDHELLYELDRCGTWMTAATLSAKLGCTTRTVKSAVARLNEQFPGVIESGPSGYRLADPASVHEAFVAVEGASDTVPQSVDERKTYILCQLLMRHGERDIDALARELCISPTTLDNEIQAINVSLAGTGVALRVHGTTLFAAGDESAKKRTISNLLFDETRDFFNQLELVNAFFPDIDIRALRTDIDSRLRKAGFFINGYALSNLVLHLSIALERRLNNFPMGEMPHADTVVPMDAEVRGILYDILDGVEKTYSITFSPVDRNSFELILSTSLIGVESLETAYPASRDISKLLGYIAARVHSEYSIDLSDEEFRVRFSLHLENLIARGERNINLKNPQVDIIKSAYPYIYEIAVFVAEIIQNEAKIAVNEDEIAFIALHIGCFIEEQASNGARLRALVVNPRHNATEAYFIDRLNEFFEKDLSVVQLIEEPDELKGISQMDLIISTQEFRGHVSAPVVRVSPFLGEVDRALIHSRIDSIRRSSRQNAMERSLRAFFADDLFFVDTDFETERDAIETMGDALIECGSAFADFKQSLYAREEISSSAYRDIALPHPIDMDAHRTAVAVSLHPTPVVWMGEPVRVVFMLSVARKDRAFFREVFELMAHVLNEPASVRALAQAKSADEFISILLSYY